MYIQDLWLLIWLTEEDIEIPEQPAAPAPAIILAPSPEAKVAAKSALRIR